MTRRRTEASRKLVCYKDRAERKRGMRVTMVDYDNKVLFDGRYKGYMKWLDAERAAELREQQT